jgi:hypothetical protein
MESLDFFKEYLSRFNPEVLKKFGDIYRSQYLDEENLQERIEFSLLLDSDKEFDLRFGLFKIYDPETIKKLFSSFGINSPDLEKLLSLSEDFVPEYGLGFDFSATDQRVKLYFLRLPDNTTFNQKRSRIITNLAEALEINSPHLNELDKRDCYLIGVDFYTSKKRNLKIYTHTPNVNFIEVRRYLKSNGISSQHLKTFQETFLHTDLKEVTFSHKYSNDSLNLTGFSAFFETTPEANERINELVIALLPGKSQEFSELVGTLEKNRPVAYSHTGLTFSPKNKSERVCLYFTPNIQK